MQVERLEIFKRKVWLTHLALLFCAMIPVHSQKWIQMGKRGSLFL